MTRSDCLQWVLAGAEPAARNAAARPDGDDFVFTSPVAAASPGATAALSDED